MVRFIVNPRFPGSFNASRKNGSYEDITTHFVDLHAVHVSWTFEKCFAKAKHFESRAAFRKGEYNAFKSASRKGYLKKNRAMFKLVIAN